ncbi:hypothetical protein ABZ543_13000 [Streptomyces roseifaciens]
MASPKPRQVTGKMPVVGRWYRLLRDYGEGPGMVKATHAYFAEHGVEESAGPRQMLVLELCESGTHGIGYSPSDSVLLAWFQRAPSGRISRHHLALPEGHFVELFGAGSEPPEYAQWQRQQEAGS